MLQIKNLGQNENWLLQKLPKGGGSVVKSSFVLLLFVPG
jgi:hypothetical protein